MLLHKLWRHRFVIAVIGTFLPLKTLCAAEPASPVLVNVGGEAITAFDLEMAISSSSFSTQFPSMDVDDQAALRGNLLKRLVASKLLLLEARERKLDQTQDYQAEAEEHRLGLLYRAYMNKLRTDIHIPEEKQAALEEASKDNPGALEAAKTLYVSQQYKIVRALALETLKRRYNVEIYQDRVKPGAGANTVVAKADDFTLALKDIQGEQALKTSDDARLLRDRLADAVELKLVVLAAESDNLDVSADMETFRRERMTSLLRDTMEKEWVSEQILQDYYKAHPEIAYVPEVRHVAQLVVKTREQAGQLRQRILNGESLYNLAGEFSIDPVGRRNKGDMGWVKENTANPTIEKAIKNLADEEISPVIETPQGFHLVSIYGRRKSKQRPFEVVVDSLRQAILQENMMAFVNQLSERYTVDWVIPMEKQ